MGCCGKGIHHDCYFCWTVHLGKRNVRAGTQSRVTLLSLLFPYGEWAILRGRQRVWRRSQLVGVLEVSYLLAAGGSDLRDTG